MKKKQIILVRHAKAVELIDFHWLDFHRPLTEKGELSAKIIARYLRLIWVKPETILASPAIRTKKTAQIIADQFPKVQKIEFIDNLYNWWAVSSRNGNEIHLSALRKTKKDTEILMLVGHNNDLTDFAMYLSGEWVPSMKKWSIVVLSFPDEIDWTEVDEKSAKFVYYLTPHFLRLEDLV